MGNANPGCVKGTSGWGTSCDATGSNNSSDGERLILYLVEGGVPRDIAVPTASSGKGWWRLVDTPAMHMAMNNAQLAKTEWRSLTDRYLMLRGNETAGCHIARSVV
jgi:hypothetical protein